MRFEVWERTGRRGASSWRKSSEHEDLPAAEEAARALCPKGQDIYTEPGIGLERKFFTGARSQGWRAMIVPV